ncbi:Glutamine cyclotransferase [Abditibacterium utsteinense]|uniref:Glutamine cyclotransferase n=1 Tax=Abditibacterium utsteinense TaxID=1960156 RepID=A0A2S8SPP3_9BACT|nr:glutaminyl-peptide cyclotransferase [Abditibacterium utsteinense]PQV62770.1 Glutamine cyclotransferase [Abditibacterium utsteinense]
MNRFFLASFFALSGCAPQSSETQPVAAPVSQNALVSTSAVSTRAVSRIAPTKNEVRQLNWNVEQAFPHDKLAFTEGLLWHNGALYESTGLEGQSDVRKVDARTGQVVQRFKLPPQLFGEGLAFLGGKFYNLTWQSKIGFVFDENFKPLARFSYGNEGWGLATDGEKLLQSDGSDTLTWRDPKNFASLGQIKVTRNGASLRNLNELEWIGGYVWANVWQTDEIVVIDPKSGKVVAQLDLDNLLQPKDRSGTEDVLNGIAYDSASGRIFVTGKNWPKLFSIRVEGAPSVSR